MDLRDKERSGMGWIDLAQDRDQRRALVNTVKCLRVLEQLHNLQLLKGSFKSSQAKLHYDRRSVGQSVLVSGTHLRLATIFCSLIIFRQLRI
jgi:hypothetical protein